MPETTTCRGLLACCGCGLKCSVLIPGVFNHYSPRVYEFICICLQRVRIHHAISPSCHLQFFTKNCQSGRLVCYRTASTPGTVSRISAEISHTFLHNSPRVREFLLYFFCSVSAWTMRSVPAIVRRFLPRIARVIAWFATEPHLHQE